MSSTTSSPSWTSDLRWADKGMASVLQKNYLGVHKLRLGNVTCTQMVRPLSERGLKSLERSIREVGWLEQFAPTVVVQRDCLGDSSELTDVVALTAHARALDGNHRIKVLKEMHGDEAVVPMRVYLEFSQAEERVIANALNDATENVVERTIFDKVYFQHELEEAIKRETKKKTATLADIRRMYEKVGVTPPPKTTLRNWQKGVDALHPESFDVLKEVCQSSDSGVDGNAITMTFLTREKFRHFSSLKQGLCIRLLARFKHATQRSPTPKDYETIDEDADASETFVENVNHIVPANEWTPDLRKEVHRLSFEKAKQVDVYVKPYVRERAEEVEKLLMKISAGDQTSQHVIQLKALISSVVASKPLPKIRAILLQDVNLRTHLESWDAKYQDVINQVNLHKVHCVVGGAGADGEPGPEVSDGPRGAGRGGRPEGVEEGDGDGNLGDGADGDGGDYGGDDAGGDDGSYGYGDGDGGCDGDGGQEGARVDGGWNKGVCCPSCRPPPTARYACPRCFITHVGDCVDAKIVGDEMAKDRLCVKCPREEVCSKSTGGVGNDADDVRKRKNARQGARAKSRPDLLRVPLNDEATDLEKCMAENTALHASRPLDPTRDDVDELRFRNAPKLAIVSFAAEPRLLPDNRATNDHMRKVLHHLHTNMHPGGTMALVVPQPWHVHSPRLYRAISEAGVGLTLEPHPLMLKYATAGSGRPATGTEHYLRNNMDMILLVHATGTSFTCNRRVTVNDIFGHRNDAASSATQCMGDLDNGGATNDIPLRALHFLVNRYTSAGDTVASLSAEKHNVVEGALDRIRRVEVFVCDTAKKDEVERSMKTSFSRAYTDGKWKASTSLVKERVVGPSCLPAALTSNLIPAETQRALHEAMSPEGASMDEAEATLDVATRVTKAFGFELQPSEESASSPGLAEAAIFPQQYKHYAVGANDLPAWGHLQVFNSRADAFRSMDPEESSNHCIRLLHVANTSQLKRMLRPEAEVCGPNAELYLRVAATCPLHYMRWTEDADDANFEFVSKLPQSGGRSEILHLFSPSDAGVVFQTPVVGTIFQARGKNDSRRPFSALPGSVVVRSRGFEVCDSELESSPPMMTTPRGKRKLRGSGWKGKGRKVSRRPNSYPPEDESDEEEEREEDADYGVDSLLGQDLEMSTEY